MHKYLHVSKYCRIFASEKETNNKLNPKTRKGTEIMTTQVFKAIQLNGKTIYSHKDKIVRTSKRDYKYALLFLAKECMGATRDAEDWRVIGLGNNPQTLRSSWQSMYGHGILQVVAIL
jgi:hypothetical protein